jgi:hypothetical protein
MMAVLLAAVAAGSPAPVVVRGAGDITPAVARYRRLLGAQRREINWDGVPDALASPAALPAGFFRDRGAILTTPGDHVAVSADANNPSGTPVRFGDLNDGYAQQFRTFSAERLFSPIGSNVVDLRFRIPGTNRRGRSRGFGAVYTDVDRRENTAFRFYGRRGRLLGRFAVPVSRDGLSFLGVRFSRRVVARVRIAYGSGALGPDDGPGFDAAVMDDFIFGTPR